jgi:hypothetical protein
MSAMAAFSICLAALNTKFKLYPVRIFQHKTLSERKDGNYVKFGNCVGFVAGQIGGDGQESKRGDKKKKPRGRATVSGTGVCCASCLRVSNKKVHSLS